MIELKDNQLVFSFPEVHPKATLTIEFQRTLRIPDDDSDYSLPPGLGRFPVQHVDDYSEKVPDKWIKHGGVMLPMYQSEAMWLNFSSSYLVDHETDYPFVVKIATGKTNAVTGKDWTNGINGNPQDYVVVPEQPWLDGYCIEKGIIRQFVAMPLGSGYSAEEQTTGKAEHGGVQVIAYPMKRKSFERRFPKIERSDVHFSIRRRVHEDDIQYCMDAPPPDMGLAPGGRMKQEIYDDPYDINDWELEESSRCFIHIANSLVWHSITGKNPPTTPPTSKEYTDAGLPWFDYYDDSLKALDGAKPLKNLKSVLTMGKEKSDVPLPENESVNPENVIELRKGLKKEQVREGTF